MSMRVRVACHVHSDWSYDGKWSLSEIAAGFSRRGYRVVMLTEHDQGFTEIKRLEHREACRAASTDKILLVPGIEYSDLTNTLHFLVWENISFIGSGLTADQIVNDAYDAGGLTVLAHPSRRDAWKLFNPDWQKKILGIEVWNRKTDGWAPSPDAWPLLNESTLLPFVGMDFHSQRQFFPLTTLLEVEDDITEKSVLAALRGQRCSSNAFGFSLEFLTRGVAVQPWRLAELVCRQAAVIYRKVRA